jgi:hypothetical protein
MLKSKSTLVFGTMALVGLMSGVAVMASAQSTTSTATPVSATVKTQTMDTPEPGDVADVPGVAESQTSAKTHGHAPLGGDGVVASINGTTIVVGEESDEGGASYTIDASKATVTNNNVAATLADVKVGAKIFVQGTTSGTNVSATSISIGHRGEKVNEANDTDGGGTSEASEPAGSSDATDK